MSPFLIWGIIITIRLRPCPRQTLRLAVVPVLQGLRLHRPPMTPQGLVLVPLPLLGPQSVMEAIWSIATVAMPALPAPRGRLGGDPQGRQRRKTTSATLRKTMTLRLTPPVMASQSAVVKTSASSVSNLSSAVATNSGRAITASSRLFPRPTRSRPRHRSSSVLPSASRISTRRPAP